METKGKYVFRGLGKDSLKPERYCAKIKKRNDLNSAYKSPRKFEYRTFCVGGVRVETLENSKNTSDKALLLLHGGAFLRGTDDFYRCHMTYFAKKLGCKVFLPDYSLMPNNPQPKANLEIKIVWDYITDTFNPQNVVILGVGSGANLALELAITLSKQRMIMPQSLVLLCPWVDMTASGDSYYDKFYLDKALGNYVVKGADIPTELKKLSIYNYCANTHRSDPAVSPIFAPLFGLPKTYICVGDYSILQSDAELLKNALCDAGVDTTYVCTDGEIGDYMLFYKTNKIAKKSMKDIINWIIG